MELQWATSVEDFHDTWKIMKQVWLYPQGKELSKQFREPIPEDVNQHFQITGRDFNVPNVSIINDY